LAFALEYEDQLEQSIHKYRATPTPYSMEIMDIAFVKFIHTHAINVYHRILAYHSETDPKAILDLSSLHFYPEVLPLTFEYLAIKCPHLYGLDLARNSLAHLPQTITHFQNLRKLSLKENQFSEVPEVILQLKKLRSLSLSENTIYFLPEEIGLNFVELKKLYLYENPITFLPESLGQLKDLRIYGLRKLPLSRKTKLL
jgi:Leucine-rich repeat (LRR) protein